MTLLVEIPRRPHLIPKLVRDAIASRESQEQIAAYYGEPLDLSLSKGEPIAFVRDPRYEVTVASEKDMQLRREEQIERIRRKLEVEARLTLNERRYLSHVPMSSSEAAEFLQIRG